MQRRERAKRADFRSRYSSLFPSPVTFLSFRLQPRASLSNFTFFRFRSTKETNSRRELRRKKKRVSLSLRINLFVVVVLKSCAVNK